jgi:surface carbohydrate biosynthesis protein
MKKFFNFFKKLCFEIPSKKKFLYYDKQSLQLQKYLKLNSFNYLETRNKRINIIVLLLILIDIKTYFRILKISLYEIYLCKYIELFKPQYVINFIDNDIKFYRIKKFLKHVIFVSIQNGLRTEINDIFSKLISKDINNLDVDYYFVFNKNIANELSKYINAKFIVFGSLKNNFYKNGPLKKRSELIYISQFRNNSVIKFNNHFISNKKWISDHEAGLLNNVLLFCSKNRKRLNILSTYQKESKLFIKEYNYFKKIILNKDWKLIPSKKNVNGLNLNYQLIDSFEVTLTSWSTLGYESFARGNKVAFFQPKNFYGTKGRNFGWPCKLMKKGKFYSDQKNIGEVNRILKYLFKISHKNWLEEKKFITINLLSRNHNLAKLKKILSL